MGMIQSNAIRDSYMREIANRTIEEIHTDITTIFGPYAQDAFIYKDGMPYFTRDGKEVIASLRFNNPLSTYIQKILCQAVFDQAKAVGDGTTTLAVLYTNMYKRLVKYLEDNPRIDRKDWQDAVNIVIDTIKQTAVPMTKDDMRQMFMTCTQDVDLSAKLFTKLADPLMEGAFIHLEKSNIESDFEMDVHTDPVIKATLQYSIRPFNAKEPRCVMLHCNGVLDIAHYAVMLDMMSQMRARHNPDDPDNPITVPTTVIILCNGLSAATRQMTKDLHKFLLSNNIDVTKHNNICFFTLDEYRAYSAEQVEDISTIITDEIGIGGLVNQLTFESLLYQALGNPEAPIPELMTFDCDIRHIDKTREMFFQTPFEVDYDVKDGIRIHKPLGPVAQARYDELKEQIQSEKSEVVKIGLKRRLKTMYGKFIDIQIGSKLLKDSQRKYELILDATISASEAVEKGVFHANSILIALSTTGIMLLTLDGKKPVYKNIIQIIYDALGDTFIDMVKNKWPDFHLSDSDELFGSLADKDITKFNLKRDTWELALPGPNTDYEIEFMCSNEDSDGNSMMISEGIVEPASIITRMLENTSLILDLAQAKTFHMDQFMENYI